MKIASTTTPKGSQPLVEYQLSEENRELVDNAFNILFEETMNKYGDLTSSDN